MPITAMMVLVALVAEAPRIELAAARENVGQEVTIEMVVASSRHLESGKFCFLNSKKSHTDKDNFTVSIREAAIEMFAEQGVKDPAARFLKKKIRVSGKVTLYREKPQIVVDSPAQIAEVVEIK